MKHLALALTILGAAPAIAFAQGDDTGMGGAPAQTTTPTTASPGSEPGATSPTGSPPEIFHHGTMGLSFDVATTASNPVIDLTYFTDPATAYDIIFGLSYAHTQSMTTGMPPVTTPGADLFGFTLGLGYRMYRHHSSKVHLYLEQRSVRRDDRRLELRRHDLAQVRPWRPASRRCSPIGSRSRGRSAPTWRSRTSST